MSKKKKAICPYCGGKMKFMQINPCFGCCVCQKCRSRSPMVSGMTEELCRKTAYDIARLCRYNNQKPMTEDEIRDLTIWAWIWIEILDETAFKGKLYNDCESGYYRRTCDRSAGIALCVALRDVNFPLFYNDYGKTWIAFRHEPTEEEREAAKRGGEIDA